MAYTAPRTYTTGELVSATILNTDVRDNLRWLGGVTGIGTSLPGSPVEGEMFILTDSVTAPTYTWHLRYFGSRADPKWLAFGGTPGYASVATLEAVAGTSYADTTTVGPSFTAPVGGTYRITVSAGMVNTHASAGRTGSMSFAVGSTAAADTNRIALVLPDAGVTSLAGSRTSIVSGVVASDAIVAKYKSSSSSAGVGVSVSDRLLVVEPIALG